MAPKQLSQLLTEALEQAESAVQVGAKLAALAQPMYPKHRRQARRILRLAEALAAVPPHPPKRRTVEIPGAEIRVDGEPQLKEVILGALRRAKSPLTCRELLKVADRAGLRHQRIELYWVLDELLARGLVTRHKANRYSAKQVTAEQPKEAGQLNSDGMQRGLLRSGLGSVQK